MANYYNQFIATLTIPSGSTTSNVISGSAFEPYHLLTIFGPSAINKVASDPVLQASPNLGTGSVLWGSVQSQPGSPILLPALSASLVDTFACDGARIVADAAQSGSRSFVIFGKIFTTTQIVPSGSYAGYYIGGPLVANQ
jgi:hypothetical protein